MDTIPSVPEGLEKDFGAWLNLTLRWKEGTSGHVREVSVQPQKGRLGAARIELRPVVVVEEYESGGGETDWVTLAEIPLESLLSVDVDNFEIRPGAIDDGGNVEELEVTAPLARWLRHPDKGLLRFTAQ